MDAFDYDETGKIVLDEIYSETTPIPYFTQLSELGYCIPERAKPHFEKVIDERRRQQGSEPVKIVDVGCSYGVNAALIKYGQSMTGLTSHYREAVRQGLERSALIAADRKFYADPASETTTIVGVDASEHAIDYAVAAGILDGGVAANFEEEAPDAAQADLLGDTDIIISTGCYGYISETTLDRLIEVNDGRKPWMAHFVLRMFDYESAAESLSGRGYVTCRAGLPVRQRRFANEEERKHVLENLEARGIDPTGREADGWYYADLHLSCPEEEAGPLFAQWDRTDAMPA